MELVVDAPDQRPDTFRSYETPLAVEECVARLQALLGRQIWSRETLLVGKVDERGFSVSTSTDLMRAGVFSPRVVGSFAPRGHGTVVALGIRRRLTWRIPGIVGGVLGSAALALLLANLATGHGVSSAIPLVLLAAVFVPVSFVWWSLGVWLSRQLNESEAVSFLVRTLELRPLEATSQSSNDKSKGV